MDIKKVLLLWFKKFAGSGIRNEIKQNQHPLDLANQKLAEKLHKPIIRKLRKRKVYSSFKDSIWGVDLADMQLISKCNQGIRFLLCVIDILGKYSWVIPLKDKKRCNYY